MLLRVFVQWHSSSQRHRLRRYAAALSYSIIHCLVQRICETSKFWALSERVKEKWWEVVKMVKLLLLLLLLTTTTRMMMMMMMMQTLAAAACAGASIPPWAHGASYPSLPLSLPFFIFPIPLFLLFFSLPPFPVVLLKKCSYGFWQYCKINHWGSGGRFWDIMGMVSAFENKQREIWYNLDPKLYKLSPAGWTAYFSDGAVAAMVWLRLCVDVNECLTLNGGCSQLCSNNDGSYRCSCRTGFQLSQDTKTCVGERQARSCLS